MSNPGKSLLSITLLNTMGRLVFFTFVFLAGYFTSRALDKDTFGEVQYIMLWVNIGWILFNLGIPNILSRYFTQALANKSYAVIQQLLRIAYVSSAVTTVITITLLFGINTQSNLGIPYYVLGLLVISSVALFYLQIFVQALLAYKAIFLVNTLAAATALLFLLNWLPTLGALAFIYSYMIVNAVLSMGYLVVLVKGVGHIRQLNIASDYHLPENKTLVRTAIYFGGSAILAGLLWQRYELSVLKYSVPFSELATYVIAFSVLALVIEPLKLIPSALIYYFASISGDEQKASEKFTVFFRHFCWLVFFIGTFVFFHAETIVSFLYTSKYAESAALLKILLIGMIPGTCSYVMMNMHVGLGKSRFLVFQDTVGVVVFAALLFLGNYYFGLTGAAWAKSVSVLLSVSLGLWYTSTRLNYDIPYLEVAGSFVLCVAMIGSTYMFMSESIVQLAVKAVLLFGVYTGLSVLFHLIDRKLVVDRVSQAKQSLTLLFR
jgi:O-antigen/teichoic acid export membrane protein